MFLNFAGFESKIILKLFSSIKGIISSEIQRNIFKSLLISYFNHHETSQKRNRVSIIVLTVQKS